MNPKVKKIIGYLCVIGVCVGACAIGIGGGILISQHIGSTTNLPSTIVTIPLLAGGAVLVVICWFSGVHWNW